MVRAALSANRAVAILDWIVGHPGERFTLSELSRALDINIPSLMAVLRSLTDAGYLTRHPGRKTYEAGPALLGLGLSVAAHNPAFGVLHREIGQLAEDVGTECSASVVIGDRSMVVADAGRPGSRSLPMRVGYRFPFMAPVGHVFVAWSGRQAVDGWVAAAEVGGLTIDRERIEDELAAIRRQGYSIFHFGNSGDERTHALEALSGVAHPDDGASQIASLMASFSENYAMVLPEPGRTYDVSNVTAPVFNAQGEVLMAVVINGFFSIEGGQLLAHAERLLKTAGLLTKTASGRPPRQP